MRVGDPVEERDDQVQPGLEHLVESAEALDHVGELLRHDPHALDDEGDDHAEEEDPAGKAARPRSQVGGDR